MLSDKQLRAVLLPFACHVLTEASKKMSNLFIQFSFCLFFFLAEKSCFILFLIYLFLHVVHFFFKRGSYFFSTFSIFFVFCAVNFLLFFTFFFSSIDFLQWQYHAASSLFRKRTRFIPTIFFLLKTLHKGRLKKYLSSFLLLLLIYLFISFGMKVVSSFTLFKRTTTN